ncbi:response regulator [Thermosulfurimonas marina]|uniref:Response regulator n=1 Tax=Thermosulfurimonas marina TaxID=2047767 RepID=A0A6H1WQ31_9BACT|nr:response regulator [Thermosulfurimonas marina]QJA05325.1 response regulator [Thermosulfurimonas marina]
MAKPPLIYLALSDSVAERVEEELQPLKARMVRVSDGEELIRLCREVPPEVVILEKEIPKLDGYAAVLLLKSSPRTAKIPVVGVCKCLSSEEFEKARDAGCDDYVCYPFNKGELKEVVEKILRG